MKVNLQDIRTTQVKLYFAGTSWSFALNVPQSQVTKAIIVDHAVNTIISIQMHDSDIVFYEYVGQSSEVEAFRIDRKYVPTSWIDSIHEDSDDCKMIDMVVNYVLEAA